MAKPITGSHRSMMIQQATEQRATEQRSPEQSGSPVQQSPMQSPTESEPKKFWPPAFGWRLRALDSQVQPRNQWQSRWLEHGAAIAGGTAIDSVAELMNSIRASLDKSARRQG
jgi:hypothetical protein